MSPRQTSCSLTPMFERLASALFCTTSSLFSFAAQVSTNSTNFRFVDVVQVCIGFVNAERDVARPSTSWWTAATCPQNFGHAMQAPSSPGRHPTIKILHGYFGENSFRTNRHISCECVVVEYGRVGRVAVRVRPLRLFSLLCHFTDAQTYTDCSSQPPVAISGQDMVTTV